MNYRKLNTVTIKRANTIPHIDECLNSLGEVHIFSKLDANLG